MVPFRLCALAAAGACALGTVRGSVELVRLVPEQAAPGAGMPAAEQVPGGLQLRLPFATAGERVFWDFPLSGLPPEATAVALELTCPEPAVLRSVSLHLRRGEDWMSAGAFPEGSARQTLFFHRGAFASEQGPPFWEEARGLRLSFWKAAPRDAVVTLHALRAWTHTAAVLRGTPGRTAPGEGALADACALRAQRLLERAGIPATLLDDEIETLSESRLRLLVLPYNPRLSDAELAALERWVLQQRGRLLVFYQANERLARLAGVRVRPYASQAEPWTAVSFAAEDSRRRMPAALPHRTRHLLPVQADAPDAVTLGCWMAAGGHPDRKLPACAVSPRALWFSHVPPLAGPAATQWLLGALALMDPDRESVRDEHLVRAAARDREAGTVLEGLPALAGEIRAVWTHRLDPRVRRRVVERLARGGVNVLFEALATAGYAHYRTDAAVSEAEPQSRRPAPSPRRNAAADKALGVALHAWVVAWSLGELPEARLGELRQAGRLAQDERGEDLPWLCPSHPVNRVALRDCCADLAAHGVAGIHLDYLRYPGRSGCYGPITRAAFEKRAGQPVPNWPADVLPGGSLDAAFDRFRTDEITSWVRELAVFLRERHPGLLLSAAIFPTPATAYDNGQDGAAWLQEGGLDFLCPMLYTEDDARFADRLDQYCAQTADPRRIVPGIGNSADESQLDALGAALQIRVARRRGTGGFAFFQADADLTERILPTLGLSPVQAIGGD